MSNIKQPQLIISTLRHELERQQQEHGDLPVVLNDADTGWAFLLKASHLDVENADNSHGKKLAITVTYGDEQEAYAQTENLTMTPINLFKIKIT